MARPKAQILIKHCPQCDTDFEVPDKVNYRDRVYCSKNCSNAGTAKKRADAIRAAKRYQAPICPCGNEVPPPLGQTYIYASQKKYCSPECRMLYGKIRQADPSKQVTFNCQTCGVETTRPRTWGSRAFKFCSNACAAKHTKKKVHYVLRDSDVVLDSSWEGLVYCLMRFRKEQIERVERETAIEWAPGHLYAPDFYLPHYGIWVEVKGLADEEDLVKWTAWRNQRGILIVLGEMEIDLLLGADSIDDLIESWLV